MDGSFIIESLDPTLMFTFLAVGNGYVPEFVRVVDPARQRIDFKLKAMPEGPFADGCVLRGRVLDPDGAPLVGATVSPMGRSFTDGSMTLGGMADMDPLAITDEDGAFLLLAGKPAQSYIATVRSRALCPQVVQELKPDEDNLIQMSVGVTVTGRILQNGQPMAGIAVGLSQASRSAEQYVGAYSIGTDDSGSFTFLNVPANQDVFVYGAMESLRVLGALAVTRVGTPADGGSIDVGGLELHEGLELRGRVELSDGREVPANTRITLSRNEAWDSQMVELEEDGSFRFFGLPAERYSLSVRVRGYSMSAENFSFDSMNGFGLDGMIPHSIPGLIIQLDPGESQRVSRPDQAALRALIARQEQPLRGTEEPDD